MNGFSFPWSWALLLLLCVLVPLLVRHVILVPLRRLAASLRTLALGGPAPNLPPRFPVPALTDAVTQLVDRHLTLRQGLDADVAAASSAAEQQSARLAALLKDLHEGVVVCNLQHQLVLYNQVALKLLQVCSEIGLGRPLSALMVIDPVQHCLEVLTRRPVPGAVLPFMSHTKDGASLLRGRVSLVLSGQQPTGYLITFDDVTLQVSALARRDALLRDLMQMLAAEDQPAQSRLDAALAHARAGYRGLMAGWWPMSDIHSSDLFDLVIARLQGSALRVTQTGLPVWVHGDGHLLVLAVELLLRSLAAEMGVTAIDLSAALREGQAWISLRWTGPPATAAAIKTWETKQIASVLGGMTLGDALAHHGSPSLVATSERGSSDLRLVLSPAQAMPGTEVDLPERPEFFDFDLLRQNQPGDLASRRLSDLTYVVFDTETTGLNPAEGDRIVSLAGVRVVGGRILTGESFTRLVHPGRPIPADSTRFHGLTDAMLLGKPPITVVLPQFKAFVADSVLVAHNAAFDLKFLRMFEAASGVSFDNPVLDTMLLASFLDPGGERYSLDSLCQRHGIAITDRHSALGDALATAALFLRLIAGLEAQGIDSLGQAMARLDMTFQLHQRSRAF